jgi:hypothetical protein
MTAPPGARAAAAAAICLASATGWVSATACEARISVMCASALGQEVLGLGRIS